MKLFSRSVLGLLIAIFSSVASAQTPTIYWNGGSSGNYNLSTSWTTANNQFAGNTGGVSRVPISTDVAFISGFADGERVGNITITQSGNSSLQGLQVSSFFLSDSTIVTINSTGNLTITGTNATGTGGLNNFGDLVVSNSETLAWGGGNLLVNRGLISIGSATVNTNDTAYLGSGGLSINSGSFSFDSATGPAGSTTEMDVGQGPGFAGGSSSTGTVIQGITGGTSSTVTTGNILYIGYASGAGNWTLSSNSLLQTGSPTNALIAIGANSGTLVNPLANTIGTLTIADSSQFILNSGDDLQLGAIAINSTYNRGGSGNIVQSGAGSNVNFLGTSTVEIGDAAHSQGNYTLSGGSLQISPNTGDSAFVSLGSDSTATGTLTQTGGTLTAGRADGTSSYTFNIGDAGTGTYTMSGGTATFYNGFTIGNQGSATGTVIQSGTSQLTSNGTVSVGGSGEGIYSLNGGTAIINAPLIISDDGTFNLNGDALGDVGKLTIAGTNLQNPSGNGTFNLQGGTLQITTPTTGATFTNPFTNTNSLPAGTVSTIDTTKGTGTFSTVTFGNFTGAGGVAFIGTGTGGANDTTFHFTGTNDYTGSTSIDGGTLIGDVADIGASSSFIIGPTNSFSTLKLNLDAGGFAYSGSISGMGTLDVNFFNAGDALVVNNTSSFTGNIVLGSNGNAGTLQVYSGTYGNISDNNTGSGVTIGGDPLVAFGGGVTPPTTGTVTFGANSYTGLTTINSGFTLNATKFNGNVQIGTPASNGGALNLTGIAGGNGVVGNVISYGGTLSVGTVTNITGNLDSEGGTLGSTAPFSAPVGVFPAGPNTPTLTIGGALTSTGTLLVRMNGQVTDEYSAPTADISGDVMILNGSGTGQYVIVHTAAPGDLTTGTITTNPPLTLFTVTVAPDSSNPALAQNLILTTTQLPTADFAQTPNERAVSGAIDPLTINPSTAFAPVLAVINNLPASSIASVLDQLSPESLQYARNIAFENSTFLAQRVGGHLANLRDGYRGLDTSDLTLETPGFNGGNMMHTLSSLDSLLAYDSPSFNRPAPNGVNYYPQDDGQSAISPASGGPINDSPTPIMVPQQEDRSNTYVAHHPPPDQFQGPYFSTFISGDFILADLNRDQSASNAAPSKAKYTAADGTAGVSFRMTSNLAAGVLVNYNHTDAKTDSNGSKTKVDSYSPGIYGTFWKDGFYANGLFSFGYNQYSNTRAIPFLGSTATSNPNGEQYVTNVDLGYDFRPNPHWTFGPTVGMTYTHLDIDSFTENGAAPVNLSVNDQSADSLRSRLGGQVSYRIQSGSVLFQPNVSISWQHEFLDNSTGITSSMPGIASGPFTINTEAPGRDSALIGVGATASFDQSFALYLNYLADVGAADYWAQSVEAGIKARF